MKALTAALVFVSATAAIAAHAQSVATPSPWTPSGYFGLGASSDSSLAGKGRRTDFKLFGGVDFKNNFGIEAGFTDFGTAHYTETLPDRHYEGNAKGYTTYLAGKFTYPINERLSAYGKLGLTYSMRDYNTSYSDYGIEHQRYTGTGPYAALGVQYKLREDLSAVAEYEYHDRNAATGTRAAAWTLGLKVGF